MDQQPSSNIQPAQPSSQPPKSLSKTWQIAALVVTGILVVGGVSFGSYYLWQNAAEKVSQNATPSPIVSTTPFPTISASPSTTPDETTGWQTYKNEQYGFEVKYPSDWKISINDQIPLGVNINITKKVVTDGNAIVSIYPSGYPSEGTYRGRGQVSEFKMPQTDFKNVYDNILRDGTVWARVIGDSLLKKDDCSISTWNSCGFIEAYIEIKNEKTFCEKDGKLVDLSIEQCDPHFGYDVLYDGSINKNDWSAIDQILSTFKFIPR